MRYGNPWLRMRTAMNSYRVFKPNGKVELWIQQWGVVVGGIRYADHWRKADDGYWAFSNRES